MAKEGQNVDVVQCSHCGAETIAGDFCEYCGTKVPKIELDDEDGTSPNPQRRVLRFQSSPDDAVKKMLHVLSQRENLPTDFFENCEIKKVERYLIPFAYCHFEAPWSCINVIRKQRWVENKSTGKRESEYYEEQYPMNGVAMNSVGVLVCKSYCLSYALDSLIDEAIKPHASYYYEKSQESELGRRELEILAEEEDFDDEELLEECEDELKHIIDKTVKAQMPNRYEDLISLIIHFIYTR